MNFTELLTFADIEHLKKIVAHYGYTSNLHSKNDCIRALVYHLGSRSELERIISRLKPAELRLLQLLYFDWRDLFSMEELLGKGRAACNNEEESPRTWIGSAIKMGWLFPGTTGRTRSLFYVARDLLGRLIQILAEPYVVEATKDDHLAVIRDEGGVFIQDLDQFLSYVKNREVPLTEEGSIYRQHQRKLFQLFAIPEKPVNNPQWRFGFGRRYHQYPDRFSLLYDYAYYRGYIVETPEGFLRVTEAGAEQLITSNSSEQAEAVRFWLRLYRRPIPHLILITRWISLLATQRWIPLETVTQAVDDWLHPYYYVPKQELLDRTINMMLYLGILSLAENTEGTKLAMITAEGSALLRGMDRFSEEKLDNHYLGIRTGRFFTHGEGNSVIPVE